MIIEILLTAALAAVDIDTVRQDVLCAEVGFSRSAENRDLEAFVAFMDPEVRFVTGRISRGPEEVAEGWANFFKPDGPLMRWRPMIVEIVASGTLAISRGPYRQTRLNEDGESVHTWGTFNSTWRLDQHGEWRVLFDAGGDHGMTPTDDEIVILEGDPDCP